MILQVNAVICKLNTLSYLRVHHCTGVVTDRCRSPLSHIGQLQPSSQHTVVITLAAVLVLAVAKLGGHWPLVLRTEDCTKPPLPQPLPCTIPSDNTATSDMHSHVL